MENDKKLCPLSQGTVMCGPKCAWWDEDAQACAVLVIAKTMRKVTRNGR